MSANQLACRFELNSDLIITDASVLICFLAIDRTDLLFKHKRNFLISEHVVSEVTDHYEVQLARLQSAIDNQHVVITRVEGNKELQVFANISALGRFGAGECSAIAAAVGRKLPVGLDDRKAIALVKKKYPDIVIVTTPDLIIEMIRADVLSLEEAEVINSLWREAGQYPLKEATFRELLEKS